MFGNWPNVTIIYPLFTLNDVTYKYNQQFGVSIFFQRRILFIYIKHPMLFLNDSLVIIYIKKNSVSLPYQKGLSKKC